MFHMTHIGFIAAYRRFHNTSVMCAMINNSEKWNALTPQIPLITIFKAVRENQVIRQYFNLFK